MSSPSNSQLQTRQDKIQTVRDTLMSESMQAQMKMALPKHVSVDRLARITMTQIRKVPKLLDCTRESLFGSIMECAQLGLEPGTLGHAWIIPYKNDATLVVGYRGMLDLAWRSSKIASVFAKEVYEGDRFDWAFGLEPSLTHRPNPEADRNTLTHVYAVIKTTDGGTLFDVMSVIEIEALRTRSRAKNSGPWVTDYPEMAKKSVLRRLLKLAPCSAELQRAVTLDEAGDLGIPQEFTIDVTPEDTNGAAEGDSLVCPDCKADLPMHEEDCPQQGADEAMANA